VVGKHADPRWGWRTYHTVASCRTGRLRTRTRRMPAWLQVEQFGGGPGAMFFNEPGSRQVYRWNGLWPRDLGHPHRIVRRVEAVERRRAAVELVAVDDDEIAGHRLLR